MAFLFKIIYKKIQSGMNLTCSQIFYPCNHFTILQKNKRQKIIDLYTLTKKFRTITSFIVNLFANIIEILFCLVFPN